MCMRSPSMPKSRLASITSSPLFIIVAESMVFFVPIRQVGWARAAARSARSIASRGVRQNGPPEAVSTIAATLDRLLSRQALKDRAMLAIYRQQARAATTRRFDEQRAGRNDELFVCNGNVDPALGGRKDGLERYRSVGRGQYDLRIALDCNPTQPIRSVLGRARDVHMERTRLFAEQLDVTPRCQADDLRTRRGGGRSRRALAFRSIPSILRSPRAFASDRIIRRAASRAREVDEHHWS